MVFDVILLEQRFPRRAVREVDDQLDLDEHGRIGEAAHPQRRGSWASLFEKGGAHGPPMRRMSLHVGNIEELFDDLRKIGSGVLQNGLQAFHGALHLRRHTAGNNRAIGLPSRHAGREQEPARAHAHSGHVPAALLHRVIGKNVATIHTLPSFLQWMFAGAG